jgi:hypothetical protein
MQPVNQFVNARGQVVRVFPTDEPFRFRVEVDNKPFDPMEMVERARK